MNTLNKSTVMTELVLKDGQKYICDKTMDTDYFVKGSTYLVTGGNLVDEEGDEWGSDGDGTFVKGYSFTLVNPPINLLNVKIDLRKPDGTVDIEKNLAFQEAVTGNDHSLYCGNGCSGQTLEKSKQEFSEAGFIFVSDSGMISTGDCGEINYFNSQTYKQIDFTYERKLSFEASYTETKEDKEVTALKEVIDSLQEQLSEAKVKLDNIGGE